MIELPDDVDDEPMTEKVPPAHRRQEETTIEELVGN